MPHTKRKYSLETLNSTTLKQHTINRLLYLVVGILWLFMPLLSLFLITGVWLNDRESGARKDQFVILWLSLTFGLIAYTGQNIGVDETDIARYHFLYLVMADIQTVSAFFIYMALDGGSNPIFYIINFLFTRIFPDNAQVHILFWITVTYFFTLKAVYLALTRLGRPFPLGYTKLLILVFLIGIIPFFTVTEIIKQCSSIAILFYAVVKKLLNEKGSLFYLILSLLVHTSSLMFLPVYFFYSNGLVKKYFYFIILGSLVFAFFNFNVILTFILSLVLPGSSLLGRAEEYQTIDVWSISFRHYATYFVFIISVAIVFFDAWMTRKRQIKVELGEKRWEIFMVLFLTLMILTINKGNVHNFVRYVYGLFPFYLLVISTIFKSQLFKVQRYTLAILIIVFFTFSNFKLLMVQTSPDVNYANSYFDNSWGNLLFSNVYEFLTFRIK
jgi:hypothetical protein